MTGGARRGVVPDDAYLTVTLESATLATLLKPLCKDSDNFFAEMLVKGLGRDFRSAGTTEAGLRVSRATLRALGLSDEMSRLADGSGLSYRNRLSAAGVAKLLRVMATREDFDPYFTTRWRSPAATARCASACATPRPRATSAARPGRLRIASCLSGYVTSTAGHRVIVAMLMNGDWVNTWYAHRAQDRIAVALAKSAL